MVGAKKDTKTTVVALAQQLIAGTAKLDATKSIPLAGHDYTPAELTTALNRVVTLRESVDTAKAATKDPLAAEKAEMPALRALMSALIAYAKVVFRDQPTLLEAFGIHPKVRTPLTVEQKAAAAAKRKATRAARNTMGPVAKKAVKGNVVGVTVTPVTTPPPVATPPTPAGPSTGAPAPAATVTPTGFATIAAPAAPAATPGASPATTPRA
jgi:hypothetical protein